MIELYTWNTPNGQKIPIFLEETGLPYALHPINIGKGEQKQPDYLAINPNGRIPAIVDSDGPDGKPLAIFESGAILIYLAEKSGQLLPQDPRRRIEVLEWLMFQMAGVGPMFGQLGYFKRQEPPNPPAVERFLQETVRLLGVLDGRLAQEPFLAGEYSIADISTFGWVRGAAQRLGVPLEEKPHVRRWLEAVAGRPAVQKALQILQEKCV
ncbi:glutathione S-transferase family protein [Gloeobacter kilaueensis]|uniref:Glutathione S-transferase n=1 Tax=Gloeobacter kilaueensis (strain ATCC BAA-2537 / CCAP 1431/1 / ULC 316 / JS1) TaxID=1183438 RepID=U5QHY6_GLOK1|nr:glutathione S-transferase N-terminal domain-containing protein [Gloeobacter kilaueensis]AGY57239.1 glutathione S-transferase [Gloeobacter kilaueensis JS1]